MPAIEASKLDVVKEMPLALEAAALKFELYTMRKDPRANGVRDALLRHHPGMSHRIEAAEQRHGTIVAGRFK